MVKGVLKDGASSAAAQIQAAAMLARAPLDKEQRLAVAPLLASAGPVELKELLPSFRKIKDPDLARVVSQAGAWAVAMHNRKATAASAPQIGGYVSEAPSGDLLADIAQGLSTSIAALHAAGVPDDRIIVDPGFGFGKTPPQNLELVARIDRLKELGFPILLGPSRKSTIGIVLGGLPPSERGEGTAALVALGIANGADIVRVHDLPAMARVARMTDAVVRGTSYGA